MSDLGLRVARLCSRFVELRSWPDCVELDTPKQPLVECIDNGENGSCGSGRGSCEGGSSGGTGSEIGSPSASRGRLAVVSLFPLARNMPFVIVVVVTPPSCVEDLF